MARVPQLDDASDLVGFTKACEAMALQARSLAITP
jgi:hypothetical protein